MQIELADLSLTSKNVTAALFALCYLTNTTPRDMAEQLFTGLPANDEWNNEILPHILDLPDDYEQIT